MLLLFTLLGRLLSLTSFSLLGVASAAPETFSKIYWNDQVIDRFSSEVKIDQNIFTPQMLESNMSNKTFSSLVVSLMLLAFLFALSSETTVISIICLFGTLFVLAQASESNEIIIDALSEVEPKLFLENMEKMSQDTLTKVKIKRSDQKYVDAFVAATQEIKDLDKFLELLDVFVGEINKIKDLTRVKSVFNYLKERSDKYAFRAVVQYVKFGTFDQLELNHFMQLIMFIKSYYCLVLPFENTMQSLDWILLVVGISVLVIIFKCRRLRKKLGSVWMLVTTLSAVGSVALVAVRM